MKWNIKLLMLFSMLLTPFTLVYAVPENYRFDPHHSFVMWHINHFGFSHFSGKFPITGTLILDANHPKNSKVNATISLQDIDTGIPELDKHLKSPAFFDVKQFPTAHFVSNNIEITGEKSANVYGILTLHGMTKPLILHVILNKTGENIITDKMTAGFSATAILMRSDFGIKTLLPNLSDAVEINIETEAYKS